MANKAVGEDMPAIMASPQTVVLAKVTTLTVHSNIPASQVDIATVELNGVSPSGCGVDSLGHLVLTFDLTDLGLTAGTGTLTLTGELETGEAFSASDTVNVK
jgi:hypothetical protein